MKVVSTIINMPKSKIQTNKDFPDFYKKILNNWGGAEYHLSRESIIEDLMNLNENSSNIEDFEHGIVIEFRRAPEETSSDIEELSATPEEKAKLYIFDDGEVYYVHEGFIDMPDACYSSIYGFHGKEFDTSQIIKDLAVKLGKKVEKTEEKGIIAGIKEKQRAKKRENLITEVQMAIQTGYYEELNLTLDLKTNEFVETKNSNMTPEQQEYITKKTEEFVDDLIKQFVENPEKFSQPQNEDNNIKKAGYVKVWILCLITTIISIGIILLGMFLVK